jgi:hypothetical protein
LAGLSWWAEEETHELRRRMGWEESKMKMKMEMFCLANDIFFPGRLE